jgi:ribosomal protein S18 acetylase RimI-like enzyme
MELAPVDSAGLDELEPVWAALGAHHGSIAPDFLPPMRERADSWARRRAAYAEWLAAGGFAFVARVDGTIAGYVMVRLDDLSSVSWQIDGRTAEIETLAVLPEHRGRGIGKALLGAARAAGRERGATHATLSVVAGNEDALRFYAREGLRPFVSRLVGPIDGP